MKNSEPAGNHPDSGRAAFSERLREVVKAHGSANALAQEIGSAEGTIRKWLRGDSEPTREKLVAISAASGFTLDWLAIGKGPKKGDNAIMIEGENVQGPEYSVTASMGNGTENGHEEIIGHWPLPAPYLRDLGVSLGSAFVIEATGDSMGATIAHGDRVLVDRAKNHVAGEGVYVVRIGQGLLVKRLQLRADGSLVLISDNPTYPPETITPEDAVEFKIIGRVMSLIKKI